MNEDAKQRLADRIRKQIAAGEFQPMPGRGLMIDSLCGFLMRHLAAGELDPKGVVAKAAAVVDEIIAETAREEVERRYAMARWLAWRGSESKPEVMSAATQRDIHDAIARAGTMGNETWRAVPQAQASQRLLVSAGLDCWPPDDPEPAQ